MKERVLLKTHTHLIAVVHQDKEKVKAGHDGCSQVHVLFEGFGALVAAADGVRCSQDGRSGIQCGLRLKIQAERLSSLRLR